MSRTATAQSRKTRQIKWIGQVELAALVNISARTVTVECGTPRYGDRRVTLDPRDLDPESPRCAVQLMPTEMADIGHKHKYQLVKIVPEDKGLELYDALAGGDSLRDAWKAVMNEEFALSGAMADEERTRSHLLSELAKRRTPHQSDWPLDRLHLYLNQPKLAYSSEQDVQAELARIRGGTMPGALDGAPVEESPNQKRRRELHAELLTVGWVEPEDPMPSLPQLASMHAEMVEFKEKEAMRKPEKDPAPAGDKADTGKSGGKS